MPFNSTVHSISQLLSLLFWKMYTFSMNSPRMLVVSHCNREMVRARKELWKALLKSQFYRQDGYRSNIFIKIYCSWFCSHSRTASKLFYFMCMRARHSAEYRLLVACLCAQVSIIRLWIDTHNMCVHWNETILLNEFGMIVVLNFVLNAFYSLLLLVHGTYYCTTSAFAHTSNTH